MDYRSFGKVNGISINIATWCDLYHLYNTFMKWPTLYSYFLVIFEKKWKKNNFFKGNLKTIEQWSKKDMSCSNESY